MRLNAHHKHIHAIAVKTEKNIKAIKHTRAIQLILLAYYSI